MQEKTGRDAKSQELGTVGRMQRGPEGCRRDRNRKCLGHGVEGAGTESAWAMVWRGTGKNVQGTGTGSAWAMTTLPLAKDTVC